MLSRRALVRLAGALPVGALGLSACSAAPGTPSDPGPPVAISRPPDGVSLRQLGFTNGPVDTVFLPTTAQITRKVDQVNVTTAFGPGAQSAEVLAYVRRTLPPQVWTVDSDAGGSLIFHSNAYDGAFTSSSDLWGLTVRRRPG